ncbi:hypothetical protein [Halorubrum cibi]|uniref:Uncharacterized protein n=1 Tax=Halorubrum cibi TaxID=413815 RepID=A0A521CWR7_9EURY|nr:hypothetical protein [Halorubrum cibi]SMO63899.1 hypothetical protein SAMN06264867_105170 [Halorubrum cibi]
MRIKPVPEPPADLATLAEFQRAVPLVPGSTDDCCARLRDRRDLPSRQRANDWLAFLRTLELARETPRGFVRTDTEPTPESVRNGLRDGVLFVPEALSLLRAASPAEPVTAETLFSATRESVPRHDRARDADWERSWRNRADRLLRWLALVDLAALIERDEGLDGECAPDDPGRGYVAGDALSGA